MENENKGIRRETVICLAECCRVGGDQFKQNLEPLSVTQKKLVDIYLAKSLQQAR